MLLQYTDRSGLFCQFAATWHTGAAGVDLFFIISGFVMVQSTSGRFQQKGASAQFILRRLLRIVPLYWLFTSVMLFLVLLPFTLQGQHVSGLYTIQSYLFIPAFNPTNGLDIPLLPPGWTLSYEMFFYAVFALILFLPERSLLATITTLFVLLATIGLWQQPQNPICKVVTNPLLLEFVFGCHLAVFTASRKISAPLCFILISAGLTGLLASQLLPFNITWRFVIWGIPTLCLTMGTVFLEKNSSKLIPPKNIFTLLGDSSYSTYLSHTFVLLVISTLLKREIIHTVPNDLLAASSTVLCLLTGYLSYRTCEQPLSRFLRARLFPIKQGPDTGIQCPSR